MCCKFQGCSATNLSAFETCNTTLETAEPRRKPTSILGWSSSSPPEVSIAEVSMPVVSWPIGVPGEGPLVHRDLRFAIVPLQNNADYVETARRWPVAGDATNISASDR